MAIQKYQHLYFLNKSTIQLQENQPVKEMVRVQGLIEVSSHWGVFPCIMLAVVVLVGSPFDCAKHLETPLDAI